MMLFASENSYVCLQNEFLSLSQLTVRLKYTNPHFRIILTISMKGANVKYILLGCAVTCSYSGNKL